MPPFVKHEEMEKKGLWIPLFFFFLREFIICLKKRNETFEDVD